MAKTPKLGGKRSTEKPSAPDPKKGGKKKMAALAAAGRKRIQERGG
jgi:hypothetical protein